MQTNRIPLVLMVFSLLLIAACKKSAINKPPLPPPTGLSADSNYLSKIFYITRYGSVADTFEHIFEYDSLKRVSACLQLHITKINGIVTDKSFDTSTFYYHQSNILPYQITRRLINPPGNASTVINYLSYYNNGKILQDSVVYFSYDQNGNYISDKRISNYTYANNQVFILTTYTSGRPEANYIKKDTLTQDANSNIISKHSSLNYETSPADTTLNISTYTYGINPSPLLNLNICNKLGISESDYYFFEQGTRNNLTSLKTDSYRNGEFFITFVSVDNLSTYTFKANGYPSYFDLIFEGFDQGELIYQYKSL